MSVATCMAIGVATSGLGRSVEVISQSTAEQNLYGFLFAVGFWLVFGLGMWLWIRGAERKSDAEHKKRMEEISSGKWLR